MTITLKEYCNFKPINKFEEKVVNITEATGSDYFAPLPNTLMVEVEGIHAYPYATRNYTRYMPEALRASEKKWTQPYLKPLIKHHNDQDGEIIGRIYNATYTEQTSVKNIGGLIFTVSVPDEKAAREVEDRRLETVSVGVSTKNVKCSICGSHIIDAEEGCPDGHIRGANYDGETCFWDIYDIEPKELSYVIVPSDSYAKNIRVYRSKGMEPQTGTGIKEALDQNIKTPEQNGGKNPSMDLEQKLDEALKTIEDLRAELETSKTATAAELEEIKAKNATLQEELEAVRNALAEKENALKENEDKLKAAEEDLSVAKQEKEAAEEAGLEARESFRSLIEENVQLFRKLLGKTELKEEEIKKRSLESLGDTLKDFKEEYAAISKLEELKLVEQIENPVAPKNSEPTTNLKDKKTDERDISLSEGLKDLFNKLV